jgi:hypothetical protein
MSQPLPYEVASSRAADAQRACYIALRRKGWAIRKGRFAGWEALKVQGGVIIDTCWAMDFRKLLNKAAEKDVARAEKARRET